MQPMEVAPAGSRGQPEVFSCTWSKKLCGLPVLVLFLAMPFVLVTRGESGDLTVEAATQESLVTCKADWVGDGMPATHHHPLPPPAF